MNKFSRYFVFSPMIFLILGAAPCAKRIVKDSTFKRHYKTVLTNQLALGPNFNKDFILSEISCGAGCSFISVIECKSGRVNDTRLSVMDSEQVGYDKDRTEYHVDSPILILRGCLNENLKRCGEFHYTWSGKNLVLQK